MLIFASLESATLPIEQRTRAEFFFFAITKQPLDTSNILVALKDGGLEVAVLSLSSVETSLLQEFNKNRLMHSIEMFIFANRN